MNKRKWAAASVAAVLAACGGGGGSDNNQTEASSVKVVGASLADSGTLGYKFTVQPTNGANYRVYSESVAADYGATSFCPAYTYSASTSSFSSNAGCTNYAVAGATINNYVPGYGVLDNVQTSEIKQLVDAGNAGFGAHDLLLVGEASANDTAALVTAYVNQYILATGADFTTLAATLVSPANMTTYASDPATLGALYMQALADKLVGAVVTNALAKGAARVAILNTLDVTQTPKLQAALAYIAAASSQANADQVQALIRSWIGAYNDQLDADVVPYAANVAVIDFYTAFNADLNNPTANGLTNTTATVCDEIHTNGTAAGTTSLSDSGVVRECTDAAATAHAAPTPPASDGTANWWKSFLFADNFHPTPHGHDLLTAIVETRLRAVGWM